MTTSSPYPPSGEQHSRTLVGAGKRDYCDCGGDLVPVETCGCDTWGCPDCDHSIGSTPTGENGHYDGMCPR